MKKRTSSGRKLRFTGLQFKRFMIGFTIFAVMFAVLSVAVTPARYDIQVGQPAPNTIKATKDVTDFITTEKLRDEAAAAVKSIYFMDDSAKDAQHAELDGVFHELRSISNLLSADDILTSVQLESANSRLDVIELTSDELTAIAAASDEELSAIQDTALTLTSVALENRLSENQLPVVLESVSAGLIEGGASDALAEVAMRAVSACLRPNYFYDEAATEAARQAERDKIAPVTHIKGEVIVSDGQLVTKAQYAMLDQLGMIKESTMDLTLYVGIGIIVFALFKATALYIKLFAPQVYESPKQLIMIAIAVVGTTGICILAREVTVYIMPVTLCMMLMTVLIHRRVALFVNLSLSIVAALLCSVSGSLFNMAAYSILIGSMTGGVAAQYVLKTRINRVGILLAGVANGAASMVTTFGVGLFASSSIVDSIYCALYTGCGGVLAAVLCVAFTPLFETVFNAVTQSRLIEMSNPNHPLLRRLLLEAPGTYHHSIIVANLAEAAANEVGANALLARVGAYYHDVGKIKRPMYFKENQFEDNPHDRTDPRVSTAIIVAHPRDGVALLKEYRIPEPIQEIVASHHGDTPVMYFYNKCATENSSVDISSFRYPGPRPSSREAALVMLADTVEAAARALKEPNAQSMRELIEKLISQKLTDGQLNECSLTFADIGRTVNAFVTVLSGAFHERIEYPAVEIPKREIPAEEKH